MSVFLLPGAFQPTWGWWLLQVGTPLIMIVGIPGNVMSFLVMKSRRIAQKSYSHYLCALAVFDSLVLIGKYIRRLDGLLIFTLHAGIFQNFGDAGCKVYNFVEHVCYLFSSWLVLCMTLERFIAVNFPFRKEMLCKPKNAVTVIVVVFSLLSYTQIFRLVIITKDSVQPLCTAQDKYLHIYLIMHIYLYQLVLQFLLPAILILICNMTILWKIRRLRYSVSKHGTNHSVQAYHRKNKTTWLLLIISFTYVVTLLPLVIVSLVMHISTLVDPRQARVIFRHLTDIKYILELLSEVNYGINFFIYIMSGAQFRYELQQILARKYAFRSSTNVTERHFHFKKTASS